MLEVPGYNVIVTDFFLLLFCCNENLKWQFCLILSKNAKKQKIRKVKCCKLRRQMSGEESDEVRRGTESGKIQAMRYKQRDMETAAKLSKLSFINLFASYADL